MFCISSTSATFWSLGKQGVRGATRLRSCTREHRTSAFHWGWRRVTAVSHYFADINGKKIWSRLVQEAEQQGYHHKLSAWNHPINKNSNINFKYLNSRIWIWSLISLFEFARRISDLNSINQIILVPRLAKSFTFIFRQKVITSFLRNFTSALVRNSITLPMEI